MTAVTGVRITTGSQTRGLGNGKRAEHRAYHQPEQGTHAALLVGGPSAHGHTSEQAGQRAREVGARHLPEPAHRRGLYAHRDAER